VREDFGHDQEEFTMISLPPKLFLYRGCVVDWYELDFPVFRRAALVCGVLALLVVAGCTPPQVEYLTKEVPVRVPCITIVPDKPIRLTPCPIVVTDEGCIQRAAIDIERLASAVDQLTTVVKACQ